MQGAWLPAAARFEEQRAVAEDLRIVEAATTSSIVT